MTLKQEYKQALKNGFKGDYKAFLKLQNEYCDKLLKILERGKNEQRIN